MKKILMWFAGLIADEIKKRLLEADVKVRVLNLQPGDKIVLRHPKHLSELAVDRLKQQVEELFPGHKAIILEEGMDIKIARMQKEYVALSTDEEPLEKLLGDCVVEYARD